MKPNNINVVVRLFQAGVGENRNIFDLNLYKEKVETPLEKMLSSGKNFIGAMYISINAEAGNTLAEHIGADNKTPTGRAIEESFPKEIKSGKIVIHYCFKWGNNAGSATAINDIINIIEECNCKYLVIWSPEFDLDGEKIKKGIDFAEKNDLSIVGYKRPNPTNLTQYMVPQNTGALYLFSDLIRYTEGFSPRCNGTGMKILIEGLGEVAVAGADHFHTLLTSMKNNPNFKWGMLEKEVNLDKDFKGERLLLQVRRESRQLAVMKIWAKEIYPDKSFKDVMKLVFSCEIKE